METTFRAMTAKEREELEGIVALSTTAGRAALYLAAVVGIGAAFRLGQTFAEQVVGQRVDIAFWILPTIVFAIWLFQRAKDWTGGRALRIAIRADLVGGQVAVHRVTPVEALEAPEIEDEGPVFFVREVEGPTLFFAGQAMSRLKRKGFPWTSFDIVEAPLSKYSFGLRSQGGKLERVSVRPSLTYDEAKGLGVFERDYGTIDKELAELRG